MRVLHLAPPATGLNALTGHTFIDQEILALRDAGVRCVVLSDAVLHASVRHGIELVPVPRLSTIADRLRACRDVARAACASAGIPLDTTTLHSLRIEGDAAALIARREIDIVHSHFGWPGGLGGSVAGELAGIPLVASIRGMELLRDDAIAYGLTREPGYRHNLQRLLARASRTLYATDFMQRRGIRAGAPPERTVLVRKGVDLARFHSPADRAAAQARLNLSGPVVLAVGALQLRKGHATLIRAMQLLTGLAWTVIICGEGPERDALQRQAAAAGLTTRFRFTGPVSRQDIPAYFSAADLFVHTASLEAAGNVILEALASGCPIVTTASGGPSEYIIEDVTGFTVPVGDAHAIACRIRLLLTNPARRRQMARAAREDAENRYAYGRMTAVLIRTYNAVLREHRAQRGAGQSRSRL